MEHKNTSIQDLPVSIIMPAYNAAKTIAESIDSVLQQSFPAWELIIVNDGSQDETASIGKAFQQADNRVVLVNLEKNAGLPNARNEGIRKARGTFIAFLDSDDLWHPDKLTLQLNFHEKNKHVAISHTDFQSFSERASNNRPFKNLVNLRAKKDGFLFPQICYSNVVGILTVMVKRELLLRVGLFDTSLWTMEDHDLWVRIAKNKAYFGYIPNVLAYYRIGASGITSKTGRYKQAYKIFIEKVGYSTGIKKDLMWRSYYRYFGSVYFKKGKFKLSRLYFCKSIGLMPYDYFAIPAYLYVAYGFIKEMVQSSNKQMT
jgi:teichuronic acid biosynthesis glycosyltransferase TuaG